MAELLILIRSMSNPDIYTDVLLPKRGHVIAVVEDYHEWSHAELTNPDWRIVRISGVSADRFDDLLVAEPNDRPGLPRRTLKWRARRIDVADITIPAGVKNWLRDDTRAQPIRAFSSKAVIDAINKAVAPVQDPAEIGGSLNVIG